MEVTIDKDRGGVAMVFDGPNDMIDRTIERWDGNNVPSVNLRDNHVHWQQKRFTSWLDVKHAINTPWEEGMRKYDRCLAALRNADLPQPKTVRRRRIRDFDNGHTIDLDRLMYSAGEPYWDDNRREHGHGPMVVTLLANLDGNCEVSANDVGWRGAGTVAICDVLEDAGYMVDLHLWCLGVNVFGSPHTKQFTTMNLKAPGEAPDAVGLVNVLSGWFMRTALFGSFCVGPKVRALGGARNELGDWDEYMITDGDLRLDVPIVTSEDKAVEAARGILQIVIDHEEADHGQQAAYV